MKIISLEKTPLYIDIPDGVERSHDGAIHLLPRVAKDITEGEWEVIRAQHPGAKLIEISSPTPKTATAKNEPEPEPKSTEADPVAEMLALSIPAISDALEDKKAMMLSDDYLEFVEALLNGEQAADEPRKTLIEKLEAELEE